MGTPFDFGPEENLRELTLRALKAWMEKNGCNFQSYEILSPPVAEGYGLSRSGGKYLWSYKERGAKTVLERFDTEQEAVGFAYSQIKADGWAWSHMIGLVKTEAARVALAEHLREMGIAYYEDVIPYGGPDDLRYRIYVHGIHARAVAHLRRRFCA